MDLWLLFIIFDWFLFIIVAGTVLYLGIFSIASLFTRTTNISEAKIKRRFIILIPAYKQDHVIEQTILSILAQSYPQRLFDVTVISDHQSEITNMRLAQYPITLLTPNFEESSKAKSLQFAILNLPEFKIYDIAMILDADNIVDQDFLTHMNNAYESAATKAIQAHTVSKNRDTSAARLDAIFEEINNAIFRKGHINLGLSASLAETGTAFDFKWFKENVMRTKSSAEVKELESMLLRNQIYIDYFHDILIYSEKVRTTEKLNLQRGQWAAKQLKNLFWNIKYLPAAIFNKQRDLADKIIQWLLVPRTLLVGIIIIMSLVLPFIYFTLVIKWWCVGAICLFFFALATPDYLVDEMWDKTFLRSPLVTLWAIFNLKFIGKSKLAKFFIKKRNE
jgi:cellulose synthase/poly-beta-1,6-N-acetylglucosamine synthase-like glycosyltransferase